MNREYENIDNLLRKFTTNTYTDQELLQLFEEMNTPGFHKAINHILSSDLENIQECTIDKQQITTQYQNLCQNAGITIKKEKKRVKLQWLKYAAAILLPLAIGLFIGINNPQMGTTQTEAMQMKVEKGNKGFVELTDGSKIWLNGDSKLLYSDAKQREVKLVGEAYFEIAHQKGNRFKVKTDYFDILVFGTSFNVSAYEDDETMEVDLLEGSVGIWNTEGKELFKIVPRQSVEYNKLTNRFNIRQKDLTNVSLWKDKELVIRDLDDKQLFKKLAAWYGVEIKVANRPPNQCLYNMAITTESLENTLQLINKLSPIKYTITGKEVTIGYK